MFVGMNTKCIRSIEFVNRLSSDVLNLCLDRDCASFKIGRDLERYYSFLIIGELDVVKGLGNWQIIQIVHCLKNDFSILEKLNTCLSSINCQCGSDKD